MLTSVDHITFSVRPANVSFYRDLLTFLGWQLMYDSPETFGVSNGQQTSLDFGPVTTNVANDYDGPGMNHLGIPTATQAEAHNRSSDILRP